MTVAILAGFLAALCYGVGSVLQAIGARGPSRTVLAVTRSVPYLAGIGLDVAAFAISTVALRRLPLFSVQAIVASSVVVTAVLAHLLLGLRLRRAEMVAICTVCVGLVLLAMSSAAAPTTSNVPWLPATVLVAAVLVGISGALSLGRGGSGPLLGLLAGIAFGLLGLSVRLVTAQHALVRWLLDPAVYAVLISGALALFLYAAALQRAHVTTTTAIVVTIDALLPATVGILLLGDAAAPGRSWMAVLGFLAAVAGAVVLSRAGGSRAEEADMLRPVQEAEPSNSATGGAVAYVVRVAGATPALGGKQAAPL